MDAFSTMVARFHQREANERELQERGYTHLELTRGTVYLVERWKLIPSITGLFSPLIMCIYDSDTSFAIPPGFLLQISPTSRDTYNYISVFSEFAKWATTEITAQYHRMSEQIEISSPIWTKRINMIDLVRRPPLAERNHHSFLFIPYESKSIPMVEVILPNVSIT